MSKTHAVITGDASTMLAEMAVAIQKAEIGDVVVINHLPFVIDAYDKRAIEILMAVPGEGTEKWIGFINALETLKFYFQLFGVIGTSTLRLAETNGKYMEVEQLEDDNASEDK